MTVGDTQPTQPLPGRWTTARPPRRRRRSAWPWIITIVIVAGLAVAAWFIAEWLARGLVERTIREQIITNLALPADQEIAVDVEGAVVPQLIAGKLDDVTAASQDVTLGELEGDIRVHAQGVAFRDQAGADSATANVRLDEAQLKRLLSQVQDFPVDSLALAAPDVTMSTDLQLLGITIPVGASLTPSVAEGDIVLTPTQLSLGEGDFSAEQLRDRFGSIADRVLRDWTVCIAEYIPAGVTLTDVKVEDDEVVADFDIDGRIMSDSDLLDNGTCPA